MKKLCQIKFEVRVWCLNPVIEQIDRSVQVLPVSTGADIIKPAPAAVMLLFLDHAPNELSKSESQSAASQICEDREEREKDKLLCWLYRSLCSVILGCFTEHSSETVNFIMSHWARLKATVIDQLLAERVRKSRRRAVDRLMISSPFFSLQHLFLISFSTDTCPLV